MHPAVDGPDESIDDAEAKARVDLHGSATVIRYAALEAIRT